ncbi:MAG: hypothetical protein KQH83_02850 [Actinobacteria bacterium]|nr:hypothetical protein [Actinomycetota bacterium]
MSRETLHPDRLAEVALALEAMPAGERPHYGLSADEFSFTSGFRSLTSWSAGDAYRRVRVLVLAGGLRLEGGRARAPREFHHGDLVEVVTRGGRGAGLRFASGAKVRLRRVPSHLLEPLAGYASLGTGALAWDALDDAQRSECARTWLAAGLIPDASASPPGRGA